MNSFRFLIFFFCVIAVTACKKDKLEGDMSILIGKWSWTETYKVSNYCDADSLWNYQMIDMANTDNRFTLEFREKGKAIFYNNDAILWNLRTVIESKNIIVNGLYDYHIIIRLNNNTNDKMDVWVGQDSLLLNDFPKDTDEDCCQMFNHFIRQ